MPKLKQVKCNIALGPGEVALKEYGARYSDGVVECFLPVPETNIPFSIHVQSEGYIAPGLAVFVFMDGNYQCNRNKLGLCMPDRGVARDQYEVDFCLRQKEEKTATGAFVGREWSFAELNTVESDKAAKLNPHFLKNVGTIEVVILRCKNEAVSVPTPQPHQTSFPEVVSGSKLKPIKSSMKPPKTPFAAPQASMRGSTSAQSEGLGGLFDGASDYEDAPRLPVKPDDERIQEPPRFKLPGPDKAAPNSPAPLEHPKAVGRDGNVFPEPPNGMTWSHEYGQFLPLPMEDGHNHMLGHDDEFSMGLRQRADAFRDDRPAMYGQANDMSPPEFTAPSPRRVYTVTSDTDERGQLDGHGFVPDVYIQNWNNNDWNNRGQNDAEGDRYFGLTGRQRSQQKGNLRDQGHDVSASGVSSQRNALQERPQVLQPDVQQHNAVKQLNFRQIYRQRNGPKGDINNVEVKDRFQALLILDRLMAAAAEVQSERLALVQRLSYEQNPETVRTLRHMLLQLSDEETYLRTTVTAVQAEAQMLSSQCPVAQPRMADVVQPLKDNAGAAQQLGKPLGLSQNLPAAQDRHSPPSMNAGWKQTGEGEVGRATTQTHQNQQKLTSRAASRVNNRPMNPSKQGDPQGTGVEGGGGQQSVHFKDDGFNARQRTPSLAERAVDGSWANADAQKDAQAGGTGWEVPADQPQVDNDAGWGSGQSPQQNDAGWGGLSPGRSQKPDNGGWSSKSSHKTTPPRDGGWANSNASQGGGYQTAARGDHAASQHVDGAWGGGAGGQAVGHGGSPEAQSVYSQSAHSGVQAKSYWMDWRNSMPQDASDPNSKKKREAARNIYDYAASPMPAVPASKVKSVSLGIQTGKGANYSHRCHRPIYLDEMDAPYAVFSFKYRSRSELERILKRDVSSDLEAVVARAEKDKLLSTPKHKLVEELMSLRLPGSSPPAKHPTPTRAASVRAKPAGDGWGKGDAMANEGWGSMNGGGGLSKIGSPSVKSQSNKSNGQAANGWAAETAMPAAVGDWGNDGGWPEAKNDSAGNGQTGWGDAAAAGGRWDGGNDSVSNKGAWKEPATPQNGLKKTDQGMAGAMSPTPSGNRAQQDFGHADVRNLATASSDVDRKGKVATGSSNVDRKGGENVAGGMTSGLYNIDRKGSSGSAGGIMPDFYHLDPKGGYAGHGAAGGMAFGIHNANQKGTYGDAGYGIDGGRNSRLYYSDPKSGYGGQGVAGGLGDVDRKGGLGGAQGMAPGLYHVDPQGGYGGAGGIAPGLNNINPKAGQGGGAADTADLGKPVHQAAYGGAGGMTSGLNDLDQKGVRGRGRGLTAGPYNARNARTANMPAGERGGYAGSMASGFSQTDRDKCSTLYGRSVAPEHNFGGFDGFESLPQLDATQQQYLLQQKLNETVPQTGANFGGTGGPSKMQNVSMPSYGSGNAAYAKVGTAEGAKEATFSNPMAKNAYYAAGNGGPNMR